MKLLIFVIAFTQAALANDVVEKLAWLDQQRALQNKATAEQLAQLNFLRMKMLSIRKEAQAVTASVAEIVKSCGRGVSVDEIEVCHDRLNEAVRHTELKNHELEQLILSPHYQDIRSKNTGLQTEFEGLVRDTRGMFTRFLDSALKLRTVVGVKLTEHRFAQQMSVTREKGNQAADQVACRLGPLNLRRDLLTAEILPTRAEREINPFLIVKAEGLLRQVVEQAGVLTKACPDRETEVTQSKSKAEKLLKGLPGNENRQQLARRLCAKIDGDLDAELKFACKGSNISTAVMYSLDRVVRAKGNL